jgi:Tol biopolymer transport system component
LEMSPVRSELLVESFVANEVEMPLWILPVPGGAPRRLAAITAHDATWSPDGQTIVFAKGSDLYLAKSDGTEIRTFVPVDGMPVWPRWSPDGRRLRFGVADPKSNSSALWEVEADGSHPHPLLPGWNSPPNECCGNWTPDGRYFVFQSIRNGRTDVWALREKSGLFGKASRDVTQLTAGPMNFWAPVVSKNGRQLFVIGHQPRGELMRYDRGSGQFVSYLHGVSAGDVSFSRDGEWVAYVVYPGNTLWRSKVDGSERYQLTYPPLQAGAPRWAPDGKRISFVAAAPGRPAKIHLISAEGGSPEQITPGERNESGPDWSPDGNVIAFGYPGYEVANSTSLGIHLADLRTHQDSVLPGSEGLYGPRWSPDGRYIVATVAASQKLMLFDFANRKWTELYPRNARNPEWSRDGKFVYFSYLFEKEPALLRVRTSDRKVDRIVSLKGLSLGGWTGLAPDDSPLVAREVGAQEIYALDVELP